jgi:hypothetical protein
MSVARPISNGTKTIERAMRPTCDCCLKNDPFFRTAPFSQHTTRSDRMAGLGVLTAARVRGIRFPLS